MMTDTLIETLIWLIPLPPVLAFFLIVLFTNRSKALSHTLAVGAAFLSWLGSMIVFFRAVGIEHFGEGEKVFAASIPWLATGENFLKVGILIDPLGAVSLFFVAWTVLMIFIYSVGYHNFGQPKGDHDRPGLPPHGATVTDVHGHKHVVPSIEPMYSRFFAFIGLFAFGMFTLVVSDNLLTLFVGWEIMGLCSYLLIGFWYGKPSARAAMIKAFITTRVGDVFMLLGIAYLYSVTGTLNFREILYNEEVLHHLAEMPSYIVGLSAAGLIGILLFIGTIGKSAQWPLHVWLPDAMEGPTPVSAMIHAATMVSAGVYMVIRVYPLLSAGMEHGHLTSPMLFMAFIGAFTALFSATIAVAQNDIKRVLAYSTISQLGFMIAALGIGGYIAATFHLITHAFFKALLFLGSGSVIHAMGGEQDMRRMGGLKDKIPVTFRTMFIGSVAIAGIPGLAGFFSKDEILWQVYSSPLGSKAIYIVGLITAFMTAFYMWRLMFMTFYGQPRMDAHTAAHIHESPRSMTVPLMVLAAGSVLGGWIGVPKLWSFLPESFRAFEHFLEPVFAAAASHGAEAAHHAAHHDAATEWALMALSVAIAVCGIMLARFLYLVRPALTDAVQRSAGPLYTTLANKWYVDEIYDFLFVNGLCKGGGSLMAGFDSRVVDGGVNGAGWLTRFASAVSIWWDTWIVDGAVRLTSFVVKLLSYPVRILQTGYVQAYALVFVAGALVFLGYYLMR